MYEVHVEDQKHTAPRTIRQGSRLLKVVRSPFAIGEYRNYIFGIIWIYLEHCGTLWNYQYAPLCFFPSAAEVLAPSFGVALIPIVRTLN